MEGAFFVEATLLLCSFGFGSKFNQDMDRLNGPCFYPGQAIWVWLKIKELGQTAGFRLRFHVPRWQEPRTGISLQSPMSPACVTCSCQVYLLLNQMKQDSFLIQHHVFYQRKFRRKLPSYGN